MKRRSYQYSLIASFALHALFLLFTMTVNVFDPSKREAIEITLQEAPKIEVLKESEVPSQAQQVVDQPDEAINNEKSDKAKYLSAHDQVVKKETVAQNLGDFQNRENPVPSPGKTGKPKLSIQDLQPRLDISKMMKDKEEAEKNLEKTLEDDALKKYSEEKQQQNTPKNKDPGEGGAEASQTSDYLKDLDKGMETLLSTREFVYYTFYSRIRRQLNQHWGGKVRDKLTKLVREGRSIASTDDRITKLLITLDKGGKLVKVQVVSDSGIRDLDQAAIEAFQEAAPFPNPPAGIIEKDGTIKIRWDFVLEA